VEEILTAKEAASFLKMNERTVIRLANGGQLPAAKIGRQWRFEKNHIIEWIESRMRTMANHDLASFEKLEKPAQPLFGVLHPEAIVDLKSRSKPNAITELVELLCATGAVAEKKAMTKAVMEREELASTGIGEGVAFPHPRNVSNHFVKEAAVAIGRSRRGIDFGAEDGEPTRLFFLVCAPEERMHLRLLARLNRLLRNAALRRELMEAESAEEIVRSIRREEERLGLTA
jgi:nitrogen PTS system EIIA component